MGSGGSDARTPSGMADAHINAFAGVVPGAGVSVSGSGTSGHVVGSMRSGPKSLSLGQREAAVQAPGGGGTGAGEPVEAGVHLGEACGESLQYLEESASTW